MNRTKKNLILIVIAVLLAGGMVFTAHSAGASLNSFPGMPPMMQSDEALDPDKESIVFMPEFGHHVNSRRMLIV